MVANVHEGDLVYIVDDEPMLVEMADAILSNEGFRTKLFYSAESALTELRKSGDKPALLVTDCVMGGMTGIELIEQCRKSLPLLKTLLLSGTVEETFVEAQRIKPDKFLPKPYQVRSLLEAVDALMLQAPRGNPAV